MNLDELIESDRENIFFEPIADDDLQILYIRPYILVSLDGFYGTYKYYLQEVRNGISSNNNSKDNGKMYY